MLLCALTALTHPLTARSQAPPSDTLAGVWGAEARYGSPVQGELTLDARGGSWLASIAGYEVAVEVNGARLSFRLPGGVGEFRGIEDAGTQEVRGEWIQPGGLVLDPPYATPLALHRVSPSVWRGTVVPLDQRLSVYLVVSSKDGKLTATVSNPEANFFHRRVYAVAHNGSKVSLEARGQTFGGTLDEKSGTLTIQIADWLPAFHFTRRTPEDGIGYFPVVPSTSGAWVYRPPVVDGDGWATSSLQAEGLNQASIAELVRRIVDADPSGTALDIQSLVIARHGKLVLDEYFHGFSQDRVHDMRSAGKTFAPVLVGLANAQGAGLTADTPLYPLFPQYTSFANPDARKQRMALRDIMTMTAGNACDDNDDNSPGNEDTMQGEAVHDWYKYTLDLPMLRDPGGPGAVYCSGDLNLVGGAAAAATHSWLPEFFDSNLARPLQFGRYYLNLMPDGQAYMGGGAYLRPRDQLKLGQLYLDGGVWNGRRLVSEEWVRESTSVHAHFAPAHSLGQVHGYGYGWHIHDLVSGGKAYRVFAAEGNGGQFVIVVPELDLVIGMTGGAYGEFDQWYRWELELVPRYILPAAMAASPRK